MKQLVLKALSRLKLLGYFNIKARSGAGIIIPVLGGMGYGNVYGTEKWMNSILKKILPTAKGSFVDIGVNIGQTLIKVKSLDKEFDYIGFEPNPVCVFYAEKLISCNQFPNTKIIPAGISNTNAMVTLKYSSDDATDSNASIIDNFWAAKTFQEKSIVVLNGDIIKIEQKIGIIKIDVEGAESMVLEGFKGFLIRDRPIILIEVLPVYKAENHERLARQHQILKLLSDIDYGILKVIKASDGALKEVTRIVDIGIHSDIDHCDYLFIPLEKIEEVRKDINSQ